ncbi:hypothetical protein AMTR_s00069p00188680 [Amborella trichopoda]|uniref:Uncharacterized protein n=1 Tax=Amborella trichopoda TaxID=13333 RepID=U5DDG1_AMBTC|nr:hypothetical protein AMTR_s00069p00188680 [Amborella trichopoda]
MCKPRRKKISLYKKGLGHPPLRASLALRCPKRNVPTRKVEEEIKKEKESGESGEGDRGQSSIDQENQRRKSLLCCTLRDGIDLTVALRKNTFQFYEDLVNDGSEIPWDR